MQVEIQAPKDELIAVVDLDSVRLPVRCHAFDSVHTNTLMTTELDWRKLSAIGTVVTALLCSATKSKMLIILRLQRVLVSIP